MCLVSYRRSIVRVSKPKTVFGRRNGERVIARYPAVRNLFIIIVVVADDYAVENAFA